MQMETRMLFNPLLDGRMFVSGVIVHDQVQVELRRSLAVDLPKVAALKVLFAGAYRDKPVLVAETGL